MRIRRRFPASLVVLLAVLAVAELAVRVAAPRLREPLLWPGWGAQNKVVMIDRLAGRGGASVAIVGSSTINVAANPMTMTDLLGATRRPVFNAALNASDMRSVDLWTRTVVVPRLHPKIVVIGINAAEFNDREQYPTSYYWNVLDSPLGREAAGVGRLLDRLESWMVRRSYLVRYRSVLRNPRDAFSRRDPVRAREAVNDLGALKILDRLYAFPYSADARRVGEVVRRFRDYATSGAQFEALDRLVRYLIRREIEVVIVRMPATDDLTRLLPHGDADRNAFTTALTDFLARKPVTYLDAEAAFDHDTRLFYDPVHVNGEGSRRFTQLLVDTLKQIAGGPFAKAGREGR